MTTTSRLSCVCLLTVLVLVTKNSHALTLPDFSFDIQPQTISQFMTGGLNHEFGWTASYDIGFTQMNGYNVTERIQLGGFDPGPAVRGLWETSTESIWTTPDRFNQPTMLDVQFVEVNAHQFVNVHEGPGGGDTSNWFSGWPEGTASPAPWAHEVGHYFGNFDEYPGGGVNPNGSFGNEPGFMGLGLNGPAGTELTLYDRYYQFVGNWAATQPGAVGAPEPATFLLMAAGLGGILLSKIRKTKLL
jgi:hypothetical protein